MTNETISYWLDTAGDLARGGALPRRAGVVVVGAGVMGASVALFLARGGADVVLVERGTLAGGATGRNAGIVSPGTTESYLATIEARGHAAARAIWQYTEDSAALLLRTLVEEGIDGGYRPEGSYAVALSEDDETRHRATIEALARDGFDTQWLDTDALQARVGVALPQAFRGARFNPRGAVVHSGRLVRGLADAAARHGATVRTGVAVQEVRQGVVVTDGGAVAADHIVLATNAWSGALAPRLTRVIEPVRGQMRATVPLPQRVFPGAWSANDGGEYWQQTADGAWVLGGMRRVAADADRPYTENHLRPEVQAALDDFVSQHFPGLAAAPVAYRWAGIMGFTPDSSPLIGPLSAGLWIAAGCTGHGMPYTTETGRVLAEWICRGQPDRDMAPFDPSRFGASPQ
ncbi:MAG: FAD-dependent oxidoreductase [Anaerolineae bacterium]